MSGQKRVRVKKVRVKKGGKGGKGTESEGDYKTPSGAPMSY